MMMMFKVNSESSKVVDFGTMERMRLPISDHGNLGTFSQRFRDTVV